MDKKLKALHYIYLLLVLLHRQFLFFYSTIYKLSSYLNLIHFSSVSVNVKKVKKIVNIIITLVDPLKTFSIWLSLA